jgi:hypothetical protein
VLGKARRECSSGNLLAFAAVKTPPAGGERSNARSAPASSVLTSRQNLVRIRVVRRIRFAREASCDLTNTASRRQVKAPAIGDGGGLGRLVVMTYTPSLRAF